MKESQLAVCRQERAPKQTHRNGTKLKIQLYLLKEEKNAIQS